MSKIDIEFAELHTPLFIKTGEKTGKNLQTKLSDGHHKGLTLVYDRETEELLVTLSGGTAIVPKHNVACMWPALTKVEQQEQKPQINPAIGMQAQVSSPHAHVFEGPGKGKTK